MEDIVVEAAIQSLKDGQFIILDDDVGSNPCSYLVSAASAISDEQLCFLVNHGRGIVCAALSERRIKQLHLPMMTDKVQSLSSPHFTASVESRRGVTTGISAADRARTLRTLAGTRDPRRDLVMPGHIFPISAKDGGVLVRHGIPEAAVDLLKLGGQVPVAAICHCLNEFGEFATPEQVAILAKNHNLVHVTLSDIVSFRMTKEPILTEIARARIPTSVAGEFTAVAFRSKHDDAEHVALIKGSIADATEPVLVRVQAEHRIGDLLAPPQASNRSVMHDALQLIEQENCGIFVYIRHPRKGFLAKQVKELAQEKKVERPRGVDLRQTGIGAQILRQLGARKIKLITSSQKAIPGLQAFDLDVVERISPLTAGATEART